jgi:hypothetical protein
MQVPYLGFTCILTRKFSNRAIFLILEYSWTIDVDRKHAVSAPRTCTARGLAHPAPAQYTAWNQLHILHLHSVDLHIADKNTVLVVHFSCTVRVEDFWARAAI